MQEAAAKVLAFMVRYDCASSIRMAKVNVAAFLADTHKTKAHKYADGFRRFEWNEAAHIVTS